MANNVSYLKVEQNGVWVQFPPLSANQQSKNKIWSTDAGRSVTGKMQGKIVAVKEKLELKWNYLTETQIKTMSGVIDSTQAYHKIEFYDVTQNKKIQFNGYFGDGTYPIYGNDQQGNICVTGMSVSIIER